MTIEEIIKTNYQATCKRGLITPKTTKQEFIDKLKEETFELEDAIYFESKLEKMQWIELADVILVCLAMAEHFQIDILKVMEEKANYNMKR
jgi:NTP pyrophosphatase (non-canonical NTP hydrolase)